MKRKTIFSVILMLVSVMIIAESANAQTKRIRFRKGTSSATVNGFIKCNSDNLAYVLGARQGQRLKAQVNGKVAGNVMLQVIDRNDNRTEGSDNIDYVYPYSGDVEISILYFPCGSQIKYRPKQSPLYRLTVSIQ